MKSLLLTLTLLTSLNAYSQHALSALTSVEIQNPRFETKIVVLSEKTTALKIVLNQDTVQCSMAGYGATFLKILIPQLAKLTFLDHRNFEAAAPCVSAGRCMAGREPGDILDHEKPTENIEVIITLTKRAVLDHEKKTCSIFLNEDLKTTVRGLEFVHARSASLGERVSLEDCL